MCFTKKNNVIDGVNKNHSDAQIIEPAKILKRKSTESLKNNLKDYYLNSPERKNKVLVVQRKNFFTDSLSE